jgi:hypothetical protein
MVAFGYRPVNTTANSPGTWHSYVPQREGPAAGAVLVALLALNALGIIAIVAISVLR